MTKLTTKRDIWLSCGLQHDNYVADVLALSEVVLSENQGLAALTRELRSEYQLTIRQSIDLAIDSCRKLTLQGNPMAVHVVHTWCSVTTHPLPDWVADRLGP